MTWIPSGYERNRVVVVCEEDSLTEQQYKDACDINKILKRLVKTGIEPINKNEPQYGDFSSAPDYQEACNIIIQSEEQFNGLSSEIRERFNNDPAKFLEFAEQADEQGLYEIGAGPKPAPVVEEPINPAPADPPVEESA